MIWTWIAVAVVVLFVAAWWYRKRKKPPPEYKLPPEYAELRDRMWAEFDRIYERERGSVRWEVDLRLKEPPLMGQRDAVAWRVGTDLIELNPDGWGDFTPKHWFAGELHNVYRYRIGLPYRPTKTDHSDRARFIVATAAWLLVP